MTTLTLPRLEEVRTPRGSPCRIAVRDDTTDLATVGATFELWGVLGDEYGLRDLTFEGVVIDVGAHIGTVSAAILLDNPAARVIAVEPLAENLAVMAETLAANGLSQRCWMMPGAVGATSVRYGPDVHRFIADIRGAEGEAVEVSEVSLRDMLDEASEQFPTIPIVALKTDCEGGEWSLLDSPDIGRIPLIFGEYHTRGGGYLRALLERSHDVTILTEDGGTGLFRAVRR